MEGILATADMSTSAATTETTSPSTLSDAAIVTKTNIMDLARELKTLNEMLNIRSSSSKN